MTERNQVLLLEFVKEQHGDQKRKYTGEPYWHHLVNVAEIVSEYVPRMVEVALCHDLFEDTKCTPQDLQNFLVRNCNYAVGSAVSIVNGVKQLTDQFTPEAYPGMNRKERKVMEAYRMESIGHFVQSVKYADLIDNTQSIVSFDPGFSKVYIPEAIELLNRMRKGNIYLLLRLASVLQEARNTVHFQG